MKIKYRAIDILYPGRCPGCDGLLSRDDEMFCAGCAGVFKCIGQPACYKCGKKLNNENAVVCNDCIKKDHSYERGFALWEYNDRLRNSIAFFKYHGRAEYAKVYAVMLKRRFSKEIEALDIEAFVPVPIHENRLKNRGYNQAGLIARELGKLTGIRVLDNFVIRVKNTVPLKELSDKDRAKMLKDAFAVNKTSAEGTVIPENIMMIDDIYTTGSTMDNISRLLKSAGVKNVYFLVLAAGRGF